MSQSANIYCHLRAGKTLTPAQAYNLYGTLVLHSRINELRSRGHKIKCRMVRRGGKMVGQYWL